MDALLTLAILVFGALVPIPVVSAFLMIPNVAPGFPVTAFWKFAKSHEKGFVAFERTRRQRMASQAPEVTQDSVRSSKEFESDSVGLYIHIPYCRQRCRYCDFAIIPVGDTMSSTARKKQGFLDMDHAYRDALLKELTLVRKHSPETKIPLRSIYFGGGTPSLAPIETLKQIIDTISDPEESLFYLKPNVEISIEIDPGTFSFAKLQSLKEIGFNRISLGVQSFDDNILESIGRYHRYDDIMESLEIIERVFGDDANYSMDLISGLPGLSLAKWVETLEMAVNVTPKPSHLSLYDLQIESGTVFGKWYDSDRENDDTTHNIAARTRGSSPISKLPPLLPTANECAFMYKYAAGYLRSKGYEHYEISSYALLEGVGTTRPSKRSTHNQIYWEIGSQWYGECIPVANHSE